MIENNPQPPDQSRLISEHAAAMLFAEVQDSTDGFETIRKHIRPKQQELMDRNHDQLADLQLLGDYQTRLSNSVDKFVFAIARGNARAIATSEDVEEAFRFIHTKLAFLATLEPFDLPETWDLETESEKVKERRLYIVDTFAGLDVTVEEVHVKVTAHFGKDVSLSTVRRDLNQIAIKPRHGIFHVPK